LPVPRLAGAAVRSRPRSRARSWPRSLTRSRSRSWSRSLSARTERTAFRAFGTRGPSPLTLPRTRLPGIEFRFAKLRREFSAACSKLLRGKFAATCSEFLGRIVPSTCFEFLRRKLAAARAKVRMALAAGRPAVRALSEWPLCEGFAITAGAFFPARIVRSRLALFKLSKRRTVPFVPGSWRTAGTRTELLPARRIVPAGVSTATQRASAAARTRPCATCRARTWTIASGCCKTTSRWSSARPLANASAPEGRTPLRVPRFPGWPFRGESLPGWPLAVECRTGHRLGWRDRLRLGELRQRSGNVVHRLRSHRNNRDLARGCKPVHDFTHLRPSGERREKGLNLLRRGSNDRFEIERNQRRQSRRLRNLVGCRQRISEAFLRELPARRATLCV